MTATNIDYCKPNIITNFDSNHFTTKSSKTLKEYEKKYNRYVGLQKLKNEYKNNVQNINTKYKTKLNKKKECLEELKQEFEKNRMKYIPIKLSAEEKKAGWKTVKTLSSWNKICKKEYSKWKREDRKDLLKYGIHYKKIRQKNPNLKYYTGNKEVKTTN